MSASKIWITATVLSMSLFATSWATQDDVELDPVGGRIVARTISASGGESGPGLPGILRDDIANYENTCNYDIRWKASASSPTWTDAKSVIILLQHPNDPAMTLTIFEDQAVPGKLIITSINKSHPGGLKLAGPDAVGSCDHNGDFAADPKYCLETGLPPVFYGIHTAILIDGVPTKPYRIRLDENSGNPNCHLETRDSAFSRGS